MNKLTDVLSYMPDKVVSAFNMLDENILNRINELRVRRGKPIAVVIKNTSYFIDNKGDLYDYCMSECLKMNSDEFDNLFMSLCDYSLYDNMENLKKGFITLSNGSRIGVASTAVNDENGIVSVKDIVSLNIRIPQEVKGCAEKILNFLYVNSFPSIIVAGKPNSGKTTLLRDIARMLSDGFNNKYAKVAVIDERNEFAAKKDTEMSMDLGLNTDVLTAFNKAKGIEIATRTLSPEMIICDEISTDEEVQSILYAFSSGISFALSVHISDREDLIYKPIIKTLLQTQEFSYIVLLDNYTYSPEIIEASEVLSEIHRNDRADNFINCTGITFI